MDLSDEDLMTAYVAGDVRAHRALFDRLLPPILHVARRQLRDEAEAEDIVQRTFLAVHRARFDFRPGAKVRPWVFTIAMNLVRDAFRRRKRRRERSLETDGRRDPAGSPVDPVERRQDAELVHRALDSLPGAQRRAIQLHWFEGQPFTEIARLERASVSAVKVRAHRGYKGMRTFIETEADHERT